MNKRGLSVIVGTLIMVLLVLVATGLVWNVIKNIMDEGTEEIGIGLSRVSLEIVEESVKINQNEVSIRIVRNIGKGDLTKIKFLLFDGENKISIEKDTNMEELDEITFTISLQGLGNLTEISVAPIITSESGKESIRDITDTYKIE